MSTVFKTAGANLHLSGLNLPHEKDVTEDLPDDLKDYSRKLNSAKDYDTIIVVGENELKVHKALLTARIPFFKALFDCNLAECDTGKITINEHSSETVEALIRYAYTGKLKITEVNVQNLFLGANYFDMKDVLTICARFMRMRTTTENAIPLLQFCVRANCEEIIAHLYAFVDKNFVVISACEDFLGLHLDEVMSILKRDTLNVDDEKQVFTAAFQWINFDTTGARKKNAINLLKLVRLSLFAPVVLDEIETLMDDECSEYIKEWRKESVNAVKEKKRFCYSRDGLVFVVGGMPYENEHIPSKVEFFDPIMNEWTAGKGMSTMRDRCGVAAIGTKIYVLGGSNKTDRLATVEMYDTEENEWYQLPPMIMKRAGFGTAVIDGRIYVCGGFDGRYAMDNVEMFDTNLVNPHWVPVISMSKRRGVAGCCALDGMIYVFGGHDGEHIHNDGERFNPATGRWEPLGAMQKRRCRFQIAPLNGQIYAVGGFDGLEFLKDVERYDPATNEWTKMKSINDRRSRCSLAVVCGKLILFGGFNGILNLTTVEMYHPELDKWEQKADMKSHAGGVAIAVQPIPCNIPTPAANLEWGDLNFAGMTI